MLHITKISFPGLGIGEFQVNSVAFEMFGNPVAWYALIITLGMVVATCYTMFRGKQVGITYEDVLDYVIFVIPLGIIGARLYYVAMEPDRFNSFLDVIDIRSGGLAIYGGIIAGGLAVLAVSYFKKINFFAFGDCVTPGVLIAQAIGRWGNFMNGEAYGYETDIFCRMGLNFGGVTHYYHPTFLYESLWNLIGFLGINWFYKKRKYDGQIILLIFCWYGLGRMMIEGMRTDSLWFTIFGHDFRTSQVLAGVIFVVTLAMLIYFAIKPPKKPLYFREVEEKDSKAKAKK